jgi:hypothetical protein
MSDNTPPESSIILYRTEDGRTRIECRFQSDTIWLTQALIAELFQVSVPTVNEHLKGIFAEGEQAPGRTIRKFRIVRPRTGRRLLALRAGDPALLSGRSEQAALRRYRQDRA